jgi:hypothetical protein
MANNPWADPRSLGVSDRAFFKPEDGKTKRIHLMGDPVRAHVQYVQGLGFIHTMCEYEDVRGTLVLREEGLDMQLLGKEPQLMWMVPVVVYDTDKKGQVGNKKPENIEYEFQLWSFYATDYKRLYNMVVEWGYDEFNEKDLLVTGQKKGRYINADFAIAAKKALALQPGLKERIEAEFAAYQYRDAERWIARTVTEEELREAVVKLDNEQSGSVNDATK